MKNMALGIVLGTCFSLIILNSCSKSTDPGGTDTPTVNPPSAPSGVTATVVSQTSIKVEWIVPDSTDSLVVSRATATSGVYGDLIVLPATSTSYTDNNLTTGLTYLYQVKAYNAGGFSAPSTAASATIKAPGWNMVGNGYVTDATVGHLDFYVKSDTPYVVYNDLTQSNKATMKRFNGTAWEVVGTAGFTLDEARYISMDFDDTNPYVAFSDKAASHKVSVMKFNGSTWNYLGGSQGQSLSAVQKLDISVESNIPYVAYIDNTLGQKLSAIKFNGSTWDPLGVAGFTPGVVTELSFHINGNVPFVLFDNGADNQKAMVMAYDANAGAWIPYGGGDISQSIATDLSLYVYSGTPYAGFSDIQRNRLASVMYVNATTLNWESIGLPSPDISQGIPANLSIFVDQGLPYVGFSDGGNSNMPTLKKLDVGTNTWISVGSAIHQAQVSETRIQVYNGKPYMAFIDQTNGSKVLVMEYIQY